MWFPAWVRLFGVVQPTEWDQDQFRSKGKLYSLIKEWRGASSCKSHGRGCFMGILSVGGRVEVLRVGRSSRSRSWVQHLCALHGLSVMHGASAHSPAERRCWRCHSPLGTLVWNLECKAFAGDVLWASKTTLRALTAQREKQRVDFIFLKIVLMWAIFKVFLEFVTIFLLFYVLVSWLPRHAWS